MDTDAASLAPATPAEVAERQQAAPEERLDPALRALAEQLGATGGAVCLFGWGEATLRLAAEVGLSDDGCRFLRTMRAGDGGWDAALACLRDRRPRVERATDAQPLPALVPAGAPDGAIACLPLVVDGRPLAVVLLVGRDADLFADAALVAAGERLGLIARIVDTIHQRARTGQRPGTGAPALLDALAEQALRGIAPVVAEVGRLLEWARRLPGVGPMAEQLGDAVWTPERRARLRGLLSGLEAENARLGDELARRALDAEGALAIERQQRRALAAELAATRERLARTDAEYRTLLARAAHDRDETRHAAEEMTRTAEARRAAAVAEAEAARAALATAETSLLALRDEVRRATAEAERLAGAEHAARIAREQLQRVADEVAVREAAATERADALAVVADGLREERGRLADALRQEQAHGARRVADAEAASAEARSRAQALEVEHERQGAALAAAQAREARLRETLEVARAAHEDEVGVVRAQLGATEAARVLATTELEALRESLAEAQAIILHMEAVAVLDEQGAADRERLLEQTAALGRRAERARASAAAELAQARAQLAEAQDAARTAQDQVVRLTDELGRMRAANDAATATHAALETELAAARAGHADRDAEMAALRTLREELERGAEAARAELAAAEVRWSAQVAAAEAIVVQTRERARALESERDRLAAELEENVAAQWRARDELAGALERAGADRDATLEHARALAEAAEHARAQAVAEAEALQGALSEAQRQLLAYEDETRHAEAEIARLAAAVAGAHADAERVRMESAPAPKPPTPQRAGRRPAESEGPVVLLDADPAVWPADDAVVAFAAGSDVVARIHDTAPARILVNLCGPGTMAAMGALRAAGVTVPMVGCLAEPGSDEVLLLGRVEPAARPPDPEALVALLAPLAGRGGRVLAAGTDANAFISLRQALTRAGMSVSIGWDAKQAADLVDIVHPHFLVVDLALPPRGACGLVAQLAAPENTPMAVLIPGTADPAASFAAALAERRATTPMLSRARALEHAVRKRR